VAELVVITGAHLHDTRVVGAGGAVGAHDQLKLGGDTRVGIRGGDGVEAGFWRLTEAGDALLAGSAGDEGRSAGGTHEPFGGKVVGIGVAGAIAGADANPAAGADALAGGLDQRLVDRDGGRGDGFEVEVGEIPAG